MPLDHIFGLIQHYVGFTRYTSSLVYFNSIKTALFTNELENIRHFKNYKITSTFNLKPLPWKGDSNSNETKFLSKENLQVTFAFNPIN